MTRFSLAAIVFLIAFGQPLRAQNSPAALFAELRGTNEVPANLSAAIGAAFVTVDANDALTFEISTLGMTEAPTQAQIYENVAGLNGPPVVSFGTSFQDGRISGTARPDPEVAKRIRENPQTFYVNVSSTVFPNGEIRGQLLGANEKDFAVAGNITNGAGDRFVTDLRIFNPAKLRAIALVEFFTRRPDGIAVASKPVEIDAKGEAVLDDVVGAGLLNSPGQVGALRLTSNGSLAATENVYNDRRSFNKGTFGQFVPPVPLSGAFPHGAIAHLSNRDRDLSNPEGFRTNIGFFNANRAEADVTLILRDGGGHILATQTLNLGAMTQIQLPISALFAAVDVSKGPALTVEYDATQPIFAYGAVNDNVSGDSIYVPAQSIPNLN